MFQGKAPTLYLYNAPVNMDSSHQKRRCKTIRWQKIAREMLRDPLNESQTPVERDKKRTPICSNEPTHFISSLGPFSALLFSLVLLLQSQIALFQSRLKRYFKRWLEHKTGLTFVVLAVPFPRNPNPYVLLESHSVLVCLRFRTGTQRFNQ